MTVLSIVLAALGYGFLEFSAEFKPGLLRFTLFVLACCCSGAALWIFWGCP